VVTIGIIDEEDEMSARHVRGRTATLTSDECAVPTTLLATHWYRPLSRDQSADLTRSTDPRPRLITAATRQYNDAHHYTILPGWPPRAGSGVLRIDPLHFLAGCRTRRL